MTVAKAAHLKARRLLIRYLDPHPGSTVPNDLDPAEVGIVGGPAHVATGTSYHLGRDDLKLSERPYSVYQSPRDRRGLDNHASAIDIGQFRVRVRGKAYSLRHFNRWLVGLCQADHPDTKDIREVIYSLNGRTVRRWDRLGKSTTGDDSHLWHTHISEFRDASGDRMVSLVRHYLAHIGLLAGEDDDNMGLLPDEESKIIKGKLTPDNALYYWLRGIVNGTIPASNAEGKLNWSKMEPAPWLGLKQIGDRLKALEKRPPVQPAPVDLDALAAKIVPLLEKSAETAVRKVLGSLDDPAEHS
jgi:hypothetical protein